MSERILYGEQTKHTLENMSFTGRHLGDFPVYVRALIQVKEACVRANMRAGQISRERGVQIQAACRELLRGDYREQFPVDVFHGGGGIGLNMNVNEVIASLAGENVGPVDDVNLNQSTSDACHTALCLALLTMTENLAQEIQAVEAVLSDKAEEFAGIHTIARTCWQDGMAVELSSIFEALANALKRNRSKLEENGKEFARVNLGWTVIGSGTGATEGYRQVILEELQTVTGRQLSWRDNPYAAAEYPDDLSELSAQVRILSELLSKFARDLRLLSSGPETGLGELRLPKLQAGSSFFPGKVNPVVPEMMIQCGMLIAGNDTVIQNCLGQGEVHINLWEEMEGFLLMENLSMLTRAAQLFREKCLCGVEANREVCEAYARSSGALITRYKEQYGYAKLSEWIKRDGADAVIEALRSHSEQE